MISFLRLIKSFRYAVKGLAKIFHEEQNLKIQVFFSFFVVIIGFLFQISRLEWIALVLVMGLVLVMETINSAVERISDVLKPRINDYVMEIKDILAGAVMLSAIVAVVVGSIIFLPYLTNLVLVKFNIF